MTTVDRSVRCPGWWESCPQVAAFESAPTLCPALQQSGCSAQLLSRTRAYRWSWRRQRVGWLSSFYSKETSWACTQNLCHSFQFGTGFLAPLVFHARKYFPPDANFPWLIFDCHFPSCRICLCFACWFVIRPGCREMWLECGLLLLRWFDYSHIRHPYFIIMLFISLEVSLAYFSIISIA